MAFVNSSGSNNSPRSIELGLTASIKSNNSNDALSTKLSFRALIHISVMQQSRICAGDFVLLHCKNEDNSEEQKPPLMVRAWPSFLGSEKEIQLSSVALLNCGAKVGDQIRVSAIDTSVPILKSVRIEPTLNGDQDISDYLSILVQEYLVDMVYVSKGMYFDIVYQGAPCRFIVKGMDSENDSQICYGIISADTTVSLSFNTNKNISDDQSDSKKNAKYEGIGGLEQEVKQIRKLVEWSLKSPQVFTQYGMKPPRGVLLYGPPGTGKTLIARTVASEAGAHSIVVNGAEIMSKFYGETEARIRELFEEARSKAPTIIFIDEIDALCPKRDNAGSEVEKRVVATLLTLMDGIDTYSQQQQNVGSDRVVVIAATNRPNSLDEALRRPGRFDREIEIGIPKQGDRLSILKAILEKIPNSVSDQQLTDIANRSHGYVGADLAAMCREAGLLAIKRHVKTKQGNLEINTEDIETSMKLVKPSTMREIMLEVPNVKWEDIGGQEQTKQKLKESVEWPLKHPESFLRMGINPPKGILLYGPPGCSKTLTAKALATESGLNFIAVKGPELFSKWVGESEKAIHEVFRKARAASPSIVFFDEIDAIAVKRGASNDTTSVADRVLSQLLNEMDGVEPLVNVTVVAATNRPDIIDSALLRPGRIDRILYIGPPDLVSRKAIFDIQFRKMAVDQDVSSSMLAGMTDGFSGAEVVALCQEAAMAAMDQNINAEKVELKHFQKCLLGFKRRITPEMLQFYKAYQEKCGLRG